MELIVISESKVKIMLTPADMRRYCVSPRAGAPAPGPGLRHLLADLRDECGLELCEDRLLAELYTSEVGCELYLTRLDPRSTPLPDVADGSASEGAESPCAGSSGIQKQEEKPKTPWRATVAQPSKTGAPPCAQTEDFPASGLSTAESALLSTIRALEPTLREEALLFDDLGDLLRLCRRLTAIGYSGRSAVYIDPPPSPSDSLYIPRDRYADDAPGSAEDSCAGHWYLLLSYPTTEAASSDRYAFLAEYAPAMDPDYARICRGEYWKAIVAEGAVEVLGALA